MGRGCRFKAMNKSMVFGRFVRAVLAALNNAERGIAPLPFLKPGRGRPFRLSPAARWELVQEENHAEYENRDNKGAWIGKNASQYPDGDQAENDVSDRAVAVSHAGPLLVFMLNLPVELPHPVEGGNGYFHLGIVRFFGREQLQP